MLLNIWIILFSLKCTKNCFGKHLILLKIDPLLKGISSSSGCCQELVSRADATCKTLGAGFAWSPGYAKGPLSVRLHEATFTAGQGAVGMGRGPHQARAAGHSLSSCAWCPWPAEPRFQPHHGHQLQSGWQGLMISTWLLHWLRAGHRLIRFSCLSASTLPVQAFCPFSCGGFVFFLLVCRSVMCILIVNPL